MSSRDELDYNALRWVRKELDETLKQARLALEAYVEDPDDTAQLDFCITYLHQVHGTLQMVELYGAALLSEELESLANALREDRIRQKDDAYEVLMRGILQLPDYLERLQAGHKDQPMVLLPLLNDLRAVRGEKLLSETALFAPDLSVVTPVEVPPSEAGAGRYSTERLRKLRHTYQMGLLSWYRDKDPKVALRTLTRVIAELEHAGTLAPVVQLWWIAGGVVEALADDKLQPGVSAKLLLGQVDRQIKRLVDDGEAVLASDPPTDLIKNLLYYVGRAQSGGERVDAIKEAYDLAKLVPSEEELAQARESLSGANLETMRTVSAAIKEDMAGVKDALDLFLRTEFREAKDLQPQAETLRRVADTLGMLGLGAPRQRVQEQLGRLDAVILGGEQVDDDALMGVAGALLEVETALDGLVEGGAVAGEDRGLQRTVVREAQSDLAKVKERVTTYLGNPGDTSPLEEIPGLLEQIKGGLWMISLPRAGALASRVGDYVQDRMLGGEGVPPDTELETLAEAVANLEYYLEGVAEGGPGKEAVLEAAERNMAELGFGATPAEADEAGLEEAPQHRLFEPEEVAEYLSAEEPAEAESEIGFELDLDEGFLATEAPQPEEVQSAEPTTEEEQGGEALTGEAADEEFTFGDIELEPVESVPIEAEPSEEQPEEAETGPAIDLDLEMETEAPSVAEPEPSFPLEEEGEEALTAFEPGTMEGESLQGLTEVELEPVPAAEPKEAPAPIFSEDLDEDIIDIFLEEAQEELANIREHFPRWQSNPDDADALTTVRRSFHTLKGSGRLVGATMIGELAWSAENLLNRVIDGAVNANAAIFDIIDKVTEALPQLIMQLRGGPVPTLDIQGLIDTVERLSKPGAAAEVEPEQEPGEPLEGTTSTGVDETVVAEEAPLDLEPEAGVLSEEIEIEGLQAPESVAGAPEVTSEGEELESLEIQTETWPELEEEAPAPEGTPQLEITEEAVAEEPVAEEAPGMDPVLYEIFSKESASHLSTVRDFVARCRQAGGLLVDDPLIRAVHTLHGSARMAGAEEIAELGGALEQYAKAQMAAQLPVDSDGAQLLDDAVDSVSGLLASLQAGGPPAPDTSELLARIVAAHEQVLTPKEVEPTLEVPQPAAEPEARPEIEAEAGSTVIQAEPELVEIFLEEGADILDASEEVLQSWRNEPDDLSQVEALQRQLHTLKGSARMAGVQPIGDLAHSLESLFTAIVDGQVNPSKPMFDLVHRSFDSLLGMLEAVREQAPARPAQDLIGALHDMRVAGRAAPQAAEEAVEDELAAFTESEPVAEPEWQEEAISEPLPEISAEEETVADLSPGPMAEVVPMPLPGKPEPAGPIPEKKIEPGFESPEAELLEELREERRKPSRPQAELVRVRAELLDNLVNYAGEVSIYRSRLEQQVGAFRYNLGELDQTVARLRDQIRKLEIETEAQILFRYEKEADDFDEAFDPLEMDRYSQIQQLSRALLETINDLASLQGLLEGGTRESETLLVQQARVNTEIQEGLMRTRMVPFASLAPRLRRVVRQTCEELDKEAELHLLGSEGEMDRTVLDRMVAPLEHMLRNAISHGIESPQERIAAGKPAHGSIAVSLARQGGEIELKVSDDGRGIDLAAIRRKAVERGLLADDSNLTDHDVMQFILESGFSTAQTITQISGRGVGMDVVNSEIKQLGGSLDIDSEFGMGTTFTVRLPFTLAINRALLVPVGEDLYAIPLTSIEGIVRMTPAELQTYYTGQAERYQYAGVSYEVQHLGALLGVEGATVPEGRRPLPVLLVRSGDHRVALQVDALLGSREIVVKSVGPQISSVRGISGATILGDGRVVLILDTGALVRQGAALHVLPEQKPSIPEAAAEAGPVTVMVVDDSITVRKVTARLLERNDMRALTAKDGVDAIALLAEYVPDVMLLDIEMPRMDGFELATHIRNDPQLKQMPLIMITSRTGEKHRQRAMEIGVDRYLGKPYQESDLLEAIRDVLKERNVHG